MNTYHVTLAEDVHNVSVTTVETVSKVVTNIDVYNVNVSEDCYKLVTTEEEAYNVKNVVESYRVSTGEEPVYNVTVIMSGGSAVAGITSMYDLEPDGKIDNGYIKWSADRQRWEPSADKINPDGGGSVPEYFDMDVEDATNGYTNLTDSTGVWSTSRAILKQVKVVTDCTEWALVLLAKSSGDPGYIPDNTIMDYGYKTETIYLDLPYEDEEGKNAVHFQIIDRDPYLQFGFNIYVIGTELA